MKKSYKDFAIDISKKAGKIIKNNLRTDHFKDYKEDGSPVTKVDLAINQLIVSSVNKYFPEHDVLAEEGNSLNNNSDYIWLCDPIDGTIPFSHGIPLCTFSLALVYKGNPILGVVYEPFTDRLFFAEKGQGAYLNGKKIKVSDVNTPEHGLVALEYFYYSIFDLASLLGTLEKQNIHVSKYCSFIYEASLVANGVYLAAIFAGETAHDAAAIKIIVEEAGGKVTDIFGNDQPYNQDIKGVLVSNALTHDFFLEQIKQALTRGK